MTIVLGNYQLMDLLQLILEGDFPWGTMKSEEIDVEKPNNSSIPFTADKELEQTLKDIIIQYNRHREETISEADESNLPEATESMAESIAQIDRKSVV